MAKYKQTVTLPDQSKWNNTGRGFPDVSALGGNKNQYVACGISATPPIFPSSAPSLSLSRVACRAKGHTPSSSSSSSPLSRARSLSLPLSFSPPPCTTHTPVLRRTFNTNVLFCFLAFLPFCVGAHWRSGIASRSTGKQLRRMARQQQRLRWRVLWQSSMRSGWHTANPQWGF